MLRWIARIVAFRILPRRLLPIVTAVELALIVRGLLRWKQEVDKSTDSQAAAPPSNAPRRGRKP